MLLAGPTKWETKNNLVITVRERGKIVQRVEGHNIWLDTGRTFLAQLISYATLSPDTTERDDRIQYIGFGIGGVQQMYPSVADVAPIITHYPGTNLAHDHDHHLLRLERPVRYSWAGAAAVPTGTYPSLTYLPTDVFLKQVDPPTHPTSTSTSYTCNISETEFLGGSFLMMPLSEIGLFTSLSAVDDYASAPVALDTFESIMKTNKFSMDINWTVRF